MDLKVEVPYCTQWYKDNFKGDVPDFSQEPPISNNSVSNFVVGGILSYDRYKISIEAMYDGKRAYALRNVNGSEVKWVSRMKIEDTIRGKKSRFSLPPLAQ